MQARSLSPAANAKDLADLWLTVRQEWCAHRKEMGLHNTAAPTRTKGFLKMGAWGLRVAAAGMRCMNADPYLFSLGTQMGASAEQQQLTCCLLVLAVIPTAACLPGAHRSPSLNATSQPIIRESGPSTVCLERDSKISVPPVSVTWKLKIPVES